MESVLSEYFDRLTELLFNPQKRVFWGYLVSALLVAIVFQLFFAAKGLRQALKSVFDPQVWFSTSAKGDYKLLAINQLIMQGIAPRLIGKLAVATFLFEAFHIWFDGRVLLLPDAPGWVIAAIFTVSLFLLDDLTKYLVHRALHRWPILWAFHKVHHSAETLTPVTVYRTHPVEAIIFSLRSIFVQAVTIAGFLYFFGSKAELITVLGTNFILFFFNIAGSNLRHSHIYISYGGFLERFLISPAQHQIHHSVATHHYDRNFGTVLAIWDWIGGSLELAKRDQALKFGIDEKQDAGHDLKTLYLSPFREAWQALLRPIFKENRLMSFVTFVNKWRAARLLLLIGLAFAAVAGVASSVGANELNIYSHRQPFLIKPFLDAYTEKTGTKINVVYASKGLAQRLLSEGDRSPADVILTVDIARLHVYADKELLAPVESEILLASVPEHLRDPDNKWFAFSKRARIIAVAKTAEDAHSISRYEDLADPKWKGRICSRPGSHVYNRALVASFIDAVEVEKTQEWAQGVMDNLARRPQGNDRAQVKAIFEGVCDIAIINNYYYGKLNTSEKPEQREWAAAVDLIFPNQDDRGTHMNISGGGVAKHSKNKEEAVRFLEFLTSKEAQELYGAINYEYPVNPAVPVPQELAAWGEFKEDQMPIARIADLAPQAQKVIDRVGW